MVLCDTDLGKQNNTPADICVHVIPLLLVRIKDFNLLTICTCSGSGLFAFIAYACTA